MALLNRGRRRCHGIVGVVVVVFFLPDLTQIRFVTLVSNSVPAVRIGMTLRLFLLYVQDEEVTVVIVEEEV